MQKRLLLILLALCSPAFGMDQCYRCSPWVTHLLFHAIDSADIDKIKKCIDAGADLNYVMNPNLTCRLIPRSTPLRQALIVPDTLSCEVIKLLIENGATYDKHFYLGNWDNPNADITYLATIRPQEKEKMIQNRTTIFTCLWIFKQINKDIPKDILKLLLQEIWKPLDQLVQEHIDLVEDTRAFMEDKHKKTLYVKKHPELDNNFDRNDSESLLYKETADNIRNILFPPQEK